MCCYRVEFVPVPREFVVVNFFVRRFLCLKTLAHISYKFVLFFHFTLSRNKCALSHSIACNISSCIIITIGTVLQLIYRYAMRLRTAFNIHWIIRIFFETMIRFFVGKKKTRENFSQNMNCKSKQLSGEYVSRNGSHKCQKKRTFRI